MRAEVLDDLQDDYVSIALLEYWAKELLPRPEASDTDALVAEVLVTLLDHPTAKVVNGPMTHEFTAPDELREHLNATLHAGVDGPDPLVVWVVRREKPIPG